MSDPDRLTSHDKALIATRRALSFALLWLLFAALFWHTVIAAGML